MNQTLLKILASREDISDYLFHFTNGNKALETLRHILNDNAIKDVRNRGHICFTEAPLTLLVNMFKIFDLYTNPMYAAYGIAVKKDVLFGLGARPVIYSTEDEKPHLSETIRWRYEEYVPHSKDFSWLREWRLPAKAYILNQDNCFIVTRTKMELESLTFGDDQIIDIEFDGCVADGRFWGDAYGTFSRAFKGVSLEELEELQTLSKAELENIIANQSNKDVIEKNLGGFIS